ncbi:hypothetical protein [Mahella australiensis]|uniref:Uncharacterized protein n=1 Tax=Mahella australiensis (strain DSM 15567 / CIP 107919 / 50-1 BON) TaxID=697281 RepID=F3ZVC4_MAHA5|nr:hypothetical protein [Mahella australiensis]AEE95274.1 hypothetical protein Mahau_0051 [Mahella australiensis 50-1 BON]
MFEFKEKPFEEPISVNKNQIAEGQPEELLLPEQRDPKELPSELRKLIYGDDNIG